VPKARLSVLSITKIVSTLRSRKRAFNESLWPNFDVVFRLERNIKYNVVTVDTLLIVNIPSAAAFREDNPGRNLCDAVVEDLDCRWRDHLLHRFGKLRVEAAGLRCGEKKPKAASNRACLQSRRGKSTAHVLKRTGRRPVGQLEGVSNSYFGRQNGQDALEGRSSSDPGPNKLNRYCQQR